MVTFAGFLLFLNLCHSTALENETLETWHNISKSEIQESQTLSEESQTFSEESQTFSGTSPMTKLASASAAAVLSAHLATKLAEQRLLQKIHSARVPIEIELTIYRETPVVVKRSDSEEYEIVSFAEAIDNPFAMIRQYHLADSWNRDEVAV